MARERSKASSCSLMSFGKLSDEAMRRGIRSDCCPSTIARSSLRQSIFSSITLESSQSLYVPCMKRTATSHRFVPMRKRWLPGHGPCTSSVSVWYSCEVSEMVSVESVRSSTSRLLTRSITRLTCVRMPVCARKYSCMSV